MKPLHILIALFTITITTPALAGQTITVGVNGMVCDFCARALEKVFAKQDAVESISVNLDEKTVLVNVKDAETISDEDVTKLINDSGYDVRSITRTEEDSDEPAL